MGTNGNPPPKRNLDAMTADEVLDIGKKTQAASLDSLGRTINTIEMSKQVASETAQKLHEQTDQLKKIDEDISEIQANLKMAGKELRAFARKIATDKLIMGFIVLIIIGIIFVIVWSIVHPKAKTSVPDAFKPNTTGYSF